MAGSFSDYLENHLLDHIFGGGNRNYTAPTIYVAVSSTDFGETGAGGTEFAGTYARVATVSGDWSRAASGALNNANPITYAEAGAAWGTANYFALFDALTSGNCLAYGQLTASKVIDANDTLRFGTTNLSFTLD